MSVFSEYDDARDIDYFTLTIYWYKSILLTLDGTGYFFAQYEMWDPGDPTLPYVLHIFNQQYND